MSRRLYMLLPALIAAVAIVYWRISYEWAGATMLLIFSLAMAVYGWVLLPTADNIGPTAPVDPDFEDPGR
ncbi:MAG: hypothetical protein ACR2KI_06075 [Candidatus Limnocylindria bacterium]|nr:MAG: hypothetical protein DLM71_10170 [Chloroflexota bacterium]